MKKTFILFLLIMTSSCTIEPTFSGAVDPTVLDPVSGLLFERTGDVSYIFFSKEQHVLIKNKNNSVNSYYKLLNGEVYRDNVVTYQLDGWGNYDNLFIGLYIETEENPQITEEKPFPETKLGITLQNSRALAINATKNLGSSSSSRDVTLGKKIQSPALYTLEALSPVVKTSAAGIFKPNENSFISIIDLNSDLDSTVNKAKLIRTTKDKDSGTLTSTTNDLTFVSPPTLSDNATIYSYTTASGGSLIGVKFDFDFDSAFPRLQIFDKTGATPFHIASLERDLNDLTAWEYGFFSFLRVLDSSLNNFKDTLYVQFIAGLTVYNPFSTSRWFINSEEDSIRISTATNNIYTEEDYLIGPTLEAGVFELLDFRNNNEAQTYSGKFFTMTSASDINGPTVIVKIADTVDGFDRAILTNELKTTTDMTPWAIRLTGLTTITTPLGDPSIAGRSSFQAYVESDTDTVHLVGGYTTGGAFPSSIPRLWVNDSSFLQKVYNDIWTITGLAGGTVTSKDTGLKLLTIPPGSTVLAIPAFQQIVGATTKKTLARPNDIFWTYGAGANSSAVAPGNTDKFSYKNSANRNWDTFGLNTIDFRGKYHSAMVAHNNTLYILGGTFSGDALKSAIGDAPNPEAYGEFRNEIYITSTLNDVSSDTWRELRKTTPLDTTIWSPRVHSRVFSVGKTMVLVGGMEFTSANTPPTPVNDVWISENNGTNWTKVNEGGAPATGQMTSGAPPVQQTYHDGPLIGTVHSGVIYLLDPLTRNVYYSPNKGTHWYKFTTGFETGDPLYGAQLVVIKNELILIGGQTTAVKAAGTIGEPSFNPADMETKIYKLKVGT